MADNVELSAGSGGSIVSADNVDGVMYQRVKLDGGGDGVSTPLLAGGGVEASALRVTIASDSTGVVSVDDNGSTLSVDDGAGSLTIDNAALSVTGGGVESSALRVTLASDSTGVLSVDDNGASLTVDNAALSVTGGGLEASAMRVTLASDSTGVLSVDDNGGSLTVDGTVAATQSGAWNITNVSGTVSLPTGAATAAKQPALGTAGTASADVITVQGITSMTALKVDGSAVTQPVSDAGGSLTIDGTVAISGTVAVTQSGTWDEVGINDSGNSITVDDGASSLTIDHATLDNAHSADFDTGGGTDTTPAFGIAVPASGGAAVVPGDATNGLKVQVTTSAAVPVTDNSGSLTVDAPVGTPVFVRLSDGSSAISTLPVSVATVPSHAVTNAGTFAVQADSVIPGTGATNLGKAEDAAHTTGDVGVMALTVRQNTAAATSGTDGDYQPLISDTNGRLHVLDANSASALTSLQLIDDTVFTDDAAFTPATSKVIVVGAQADETATDSVDEGDAGALRMTLDRKLHVVVEHESSSVRASGTACTVKYAAIAAASSGDNTLVAAVASKKIRVLSMTLVAASAVSIYFTSGAGGTVIFGGSTNKMALAANGGFVLPYSNVGYFENSSANQALVMNLSSAVAVSGGLTYIEV